MPRTRTKYIWPPPSLATDATPEPRAKKPRIEPPSPVKDGNAMNKKQDAPDAEDLPPFIQAILSVPMDVQIRTYRDWRHLGSPHEDFCMICEQTRSQPLIPCTTCNKSFHEDCLPPGSICDEQRQYFCRVCVLRNWHAQPPTITPPDSPVLPPATAVDRSSAQGNEESRNNTRAADQKPTGNQALSILAEISRSMSHGESSNAHGVSNSHRPSNISAYFCNPPLSTPGLPRQQGSSLMSPHLNEYCTSSCSSSSNAHGTPVMDSHARKSKFATLSTEVDSALWVLYRELESVTSLRQRIGELEAEVVKLRQDVSIRDNQIILSRRSLSSSANLPGGISQAEVDRLRVQAVRGEEALREIESIRAKNITLEKDLKEAKDECAAKDKTLIEWKGRLVSLIGT
ncbi:hypothetical protein UA08_02898 [Talaromyces atroroseus]|uniref:PHD-type domain-containing protein n=1 Tax=Talaromyces atroroseus TaxID=1441469 RepID=A0A225ATR2_TALAT|nr:hypothetical protein UA08_02898 [Talaromyces atroroseus]OKL61754.1 hypothetical protein UA08_02898 [Talaromyces atroroseus]